MRGIGGELRWLVGVRLWSVWWDSCSSVARSGFLLQPSSSEPESLDTTIASDLYWVGLGSDISRLPVGGEEEMSIRSKSVMVGRWEMVSVRLRTAKDGLS